MRHTRSSFIGESVVTSGLCRIGNLREIPKEEQELFTSFCKYVSGWLVVHAGGSYVMVARNIVQLIWKSECPSQNLSRASVVAEKNRRRALKMKIIESPVGAT